MESDERSSSLFFSSSSLLSAVARGGRDASDSGKAAKSVVESD